jgi:hypothetical protein
MVPTVSARRSGSTAVSVIESVLLEEGEAPDALGQLDRKEYAR